MDEQITLSAVESDSYVKPDSYREDIFLGSFIPQLREIVAVLGIDPERLTFSPKSEYSSVFLSNFTVFRLRIRKNAHYILIPTLFADLIPSDIPHKVSASMPKYIRVPVDKQHPVESYHDLLVSVTRESVNRYPTEWDCCSRYMECSDAKKCVHPDKAFALGCGYRKVLQSGRIFYGSNRNVD